MALQYFNTSGWYTNEKQFYQMEASSNSAKSDSRHHEYLIYLKKLVSMIICLLWYFTLKALPQLLGMQTLTTESGNPIRNDLRDLCGIPIAYQF